MKNIFLVLITFCLSLFSCNSSKTVVDKSATLDGSWQLNYISGSKIAFNGLYPNDKPIIIINLKENSFSGNNSCNRYSGSFSHNKSKIKFDTTKTAMTMMACPGNGDAVFMSTLGTIDSYSISDNGKTLNLIMGDIAVMRFEKTGP